MCRRSALRLAIASALALLTTAAYPQQTTLLVDLDHRPQVSLDGPWHYIADPYREGWGSNPDHASLNGYAKNAHYVPGGPLLQYDFARSPTLDVPGDWNSQKDSLFYYEGLLWYQRDFTYRPREHTRIFLHVGAANYRSWFWVNGQKVCEHEGGFTSFNCEVTAAIHAGANFVAAAVDNTAARRMFPPSRPIGGTTAASPARSL